MKEVVSLIVGILSFIGVIITIIFSFLNNQRTIQTQEKINKMQGVFNERQRIVETIGTQRILWVNKVRDLFVDFNSLIHTMAFISDKVENGEITVSEATELEKSYFECIKITNSIELLLNPNEIYTKFLIDRMNEIRIKVIQNEMKIEEINPYIKMIRYAQNVILKTEWKRIKKETENGEFLSEEEVYHLFNEVAEKHDYNAHRLVMAKYREL